MLHVAVLGCASSLLWQCIRVSALCKGAEVDKFETYFIKMKQSAEHTVYGCVNERKTKDSFPTRYFSVEQVK